MKPIWDRCRATPGGAGRPHATPWSDDFSNIVGAFKWRN
jgi:hypothetical protein